jgi:type I restriction enzyme M protein
MTGLKQMITNAPDSAWRLYGMLATPWYRAGAEPFDCIETVLELAAAAKRGSEVLKPDNGELTLRSWEKLRGELTRSLDLPPASNLDRFLKLPGLLEQTRRALALELADSGHAEAMLKFLVHAPQTDFRHAPVGYFKWPEDLGLLCTGLLGKPSSHPLYCPFDSSGWLPLLLARAGWTVMCEVTNAQAARVLMLFAYIGGWKLTARVGDALRQPAWVEKGTLFRFKHSAAVTSFGLRLRENVEHDRWARFSVRLHQGEGLQVAHLVAQTNGRSLVIVPEGFLFRTAGGERDYKEQLVRRGLLSAVIRLPKGAFAPFTGIHTSILMLDTAKPSESVLFVDASDHLGGKDRRQAELAEIADPVGQILALVDKRRVSPVSAVASYDEIMAQDFNLSVDRYVRSEAEQQLALALDEAKTLELSDIAEVIRPQTVAGTASEFTHPFGEVGLQDIEADGSIRDPAKRVVVAEGALTRANRQRLGPGDVLLSVRGRIGTVGMVPEGATKSAQPWIASQAFVILRPRGGSQVSSLALYRYLSSPTGQGLLQSLASGTTVPMVSIGDVKKLRVMIPTPSEQREIEKQYDKLRRLRAEIRELEEQADALRSSGWPMTKVAAINSTDEAR